MLLKIHVVPPYGIASYPCYLSYLLLSLKRYGSLCSQRGSTVLSCHICFSTSAFSSAVGRNPTGSVIFLKSTVTSPVAFLHVSSTGPLLEGGKKATKSIILFIILFVLPPPPPHGNLQIIVESRTWCIWEIQAGGFNWVCWNLDLAWQVSNASICHRSWRIVLMPRYKKLPRVGPTAVAIKSAASPPVFKGHFIG